MPSCKISISGIISGLYTRRGWDLLSTHLHTFHFFCARLLQSAVTAEKRAEIGRRAAEHGVVSTVRYYTSKLPEELKESSVRTWRNSYLAELENKKNQASRLPQNQARISCEWIQGSCDCRVPYFRLKIMYPCSLHNDSMLSIIDRK